jgi:5-formyltetrahydrofolate cyclo-ligase
MKAFDLAIYKSLYRNKLAENIKKFRSCCRLKKSHRIAEKIIGLPIFRKALNIMIYVSFKEEVQTRPIIAKFLLMGKNVFVPRVNRRRKEIVAVRIHHISKNLSKGSYGILEPRRDGSETISPSSLNLIVVPGVGFDSFGGRLGRGGGYFDRFLRKRKQAMAIGLAFEKQMIGKLPMGLGDEYIDGVVTESRIVFRARRRER